MGLIYLLFKVQSSKRVHFAVVITTAAAILFLYYYFTYTLPTEPGWLEWFWGVFFFEFSHHFVGALLTIPILYSALTIGWKRSSLILLALLIFISPFILTFSFHGSILTVSYAVLIVPAAVVMTIELETIKRMQDKKTIEERKEERLAFLRQIFKTQENERKRLAQELHDGVIQTLLVNASVVRDLIQTHQEKPAEAIEKDLKMVENNSLYIAEDIRRVCRYLRPSILDNLGLVPAIRWLMDSFREETGIKLNFSFEGTIFELSQDESAVLFRLVQEILNNIRKHAEATIVDTSIRFIDLKVSVVIRDNGKGFELPKNVNKLASAGKLGLIGMYERAQTIGADLQINSVSGRGTEVRILLERNLKGVVTGQTVRV